MSISHGRAQRQEVAVDRRRRRRGRRGRRVEGGGALDGDSTAPPPHQHPSTVVMAECRGRARLGRAGPGPVLLGTLLAAGALAPNSPPPRKHMGAARRGRRERMEIFGGMNHCSCADGRNPSLVFWMSKKQNKKQNWAEHLGVCVCVLWGGWLQKHRRRLEIIEERRSMNER